MTEEEILQKIKKLPQTRYTLAKNKTDLLKIHKIMKRLEKRNLICRRYFHIDGTRQTVYVEKNIKGYLVNYLAPDINNLNKKKEYLLYFLNYRHLDFDFYVSSCMLLDSNNWIKLKGVYLNKNNVRCFC
jgi:hypothetical protein